MYQNQNIKLDPSQDCVSEVSDYGSRHYKLFQARRKLDTGDSDDFAIQLDKQMQISYEVVREGSTAISPTFTSSGVVEHVFTDPQHLLFLSDGQTTKGWGHLTELRRVPVYEMHGFMLFIAWMPLGYVLLASKRYLKGNWKVWHFVHIFIGIVTLVLTIWQTLEISLKFGWGLTDDVHSILGSICIVATIFATFTGFLAAAYMRFYNGDEEWSKKETATIIGKIHRWSSYFVLFFANVIILGGTITYCLAYLKESKYIPLGILSFLFFLNLVLVSEYLHRKKAKSENLASTQVAEHELGNAKKRSSKYKLQTREYTAQQVDIAVERGEKLVILDNLVLNTNGYER